MANIAIVYWSGTGNTETMATLIADGVKHAGGQAELFTAAAFSPELISHYDAIAFGCPSMGAEELEESEFEPLFSACLPHLTGKKIALFGSYGWGDGEWMRSWEASCRQQGLDLVAAGLICHETPDDQSSAACTALGRTLADI